jgi:hypothetical protein
LDDRAVSQTLAAACPDPILAVKVSVRPREATIDHRLAVARAVLNQLEAQRA